MKNCYLLLATLLWGAAGFAQTGPMGGLAPLAELPVFALPAFDNNALLAAEEARRGAGIAPRFAESMDVSLHPGNSGSWEHTVKGLSVWRLRIRSAGAYSLNLGFSRYHLPEGAALLLYDPAQEHLMGPFTPADNEEHEQLWTPILPGDEIVIELQVPTASRSEVQLHLSSVNHAFIDFLSVVSGSCNLDVVCGAADGWPEVDQYRDIIQSVAVISTGGSTFCTGFLVNNARNDCTPYFMTARHCGINSGNAASLVTYWNFENSFCRQPNSPASGEPGDGQLIDFNTGATWRAGSGASDFTLVELDDPVSPTADAFFAGWDASGGPLDGAVAIHHPNGDEKRISFENDPLMFTTYGGTSPTANFTHVRVPDWDVGTTEPGSSGSPLFDLNHRVVGQLHGGGAACGNNLSDWYGALAVSWDGSSPSNRLRDWLDPDDTGLLVMDGRYNTGCAFELTVTPSEQLVCDGVDAVYQISVNDAFSGTAHLSIDGPIAPNSEVIFADESLSPGGGTTLTIGNMANVPPGDYTLTVAANVDGATVFVTIGLEVGPGPEDVPTLVSPDDGLTPAESNPTLVWLPTSGAPLHEVQIATDPNFNNIVEQVTAPGSSYTATAMSQPATTYYWRVRPASVCESGVFSSVFSLTTGSWQCETYASNQPTPISTVGGEVINSDIQVGDAFEIVDINLELEVTHTWIGDLSATLTTPSGATRQLFERPSAGSCDQDNLYLFLDDQAFFDYNDFFDYCALSETGYGNPGPPHAIAGGYRPLDDFVELAGENSQGAWRLSITDHANLDGGRLEGWRLTVCHQPPTPPVLISNQLLIVPHGDDAPITADNLDATDGQYGPDELFYVLTSLPEHGQLLLNGVPLAMGASFIQLDIYNNALSYLHDGGTGLTDAFGFVLENGAGLSAPEAALAILIEAPDLSASLSITDALDCFGDANAAVAVNAEGGVAPFEYSLDGSDYQDEATFTGLSAGVYTASVRDALGTTTSTNIVTVSQPLLLEATATVDGMNITVSAAGGAQPYTFSRNGTDYQPNPVFTNLPNGHYTLTVRDANGCEVTTTATVLVNTLSVTGTVVQGILCQGGTDGIISATVEGGGAPFEYSLNGTDFQGDAFFENLSAGSYTIIVRDANDFTATTEPIAVTQPTALVVSAVVNDMSIALNAAGGTPPYAYSLDGMTFQEETTFTDLPNGHYTLTVRDANGCEATTAATVSFNSLEINGVVAAPVSCHGAEDGVITAMASGGTPPYMYSLDGVNFQPQASFPGLPAGNYTITVRDDEGFERTSGVLLITEPTPLTLTVTTEGYTITAEAMGGIPPYVYSLDGVNFQDEPLFTNLGNSAYVVVINDANGCDAVATALIDDNNLNLSGAEVHPVSCHGLADGAITLEAGGGTPPLLYSLEGSNFQESPTFAGLPAGMYTVTVRDAAGFIHESAPLTVEEPEPLEASVLVEGMTIILTVAGGTPPYTYSLDGVTFADSAAFADLPNGDYLLWVRDANGCSLTVMASVSVNTLVVSGSIVQPITCPGGTDGAVAAQAGGGTPPLAYSLDGTSFQSGAAFTGLGAGTYSITVRDAEGFTQTTGGLELTAPPPITIGLELDGSGLHVLAAGGTPPYQYSLDSVNFQADSVFTSLPAGEYGLWVRDSQGCETSYPGPIVVTDVRVVAADFTFSLHPNPGRGRCTITLPADLSGQVELTVTNGLGQIALRAEGRGPVLELFADSLPSGCYWVRVKAGPSWAVRAWMIH